LKHGVNIEIFTGASPTRSYVRSSMGVRNSS
jgi:hypothetical protein